MAGILGQVGGAGVAASNFNGEDDPDAAPEHAEQASPEEQAMYEMFVTNGFKTLYGTKEGDGPVRKDILGRLSAGDDPTESLAQTAVWLTMLVEKSAEQAGKQLPDEIVMHGGKALFEELVEVSEAAKIHDFNEREMQGAWYKALDMYREANTRNEENPNGRVDPAELTAQFQALDEADRAGQGRELLGMDPSVAAQKAEAAAGMSEQRMGQDEEPPADQ